MQQMTYSTQLLTVYYVTVVILRMTIWDDIANSSHSMISFGISLTTNFNVMNVM